jgi:hypothetical protein
MGAGVVARAALGLLTAAGVYIAVAGAASDTIVDTADAPEPRWVAGVLPGVLPGITGTGFAVALAVMAVAYTVVVAYAERLPRRPTLAALGIVAAAMALAPPLLSSDVFGYIGYARLGMVHGLDPYAYAPIAAPRDPILPLIFWQDATSPYGPLFTLGTDPLGTVSLPAALWALKGAAAVAFGCALVLTWRTAPLVGQPPLRAVTILGANPLLLVYTLGGAHSDVVVMALVVAAISAIVGGRPAGGGAILATALAVKATAGVALPFALAGPRRRGRVLAGFMAAAVALGALSVAVFGLRVGNGAARIVTTHEFDVADTGPDLVGRALGTGISAGVRAACAAAVVAVAAVLLRGVLRGTTDWLTAAGWTILVLLVASASFQPWYLAWVLPFAALSGSRGLVTGTLALTVAATVTHLSILGFAAS